MDNERLEATREQYLRNPESHASKVAYINALEYELSQAQSNVPVAFTEEQLKEYGQFAITRGVKPTDAYRLLAFATNELIPASHNRRNK